MDLEDFLVTLDDSFGEENKVAARFTMTGVDPRTHEKVERSGIAIVHLADGKIAEHWIHLMN
jgi:hypothetical protein